MAERRETRLEVERERGFAWIVLDAPERRNALNAGLVAEVADALEEAAAEDAVRVIGLRGEGPDFCAGADLREVRDSVEEGVLAALEDADRLGDLFVLIRRLEKPVVAAVHGRALGGGCGLATACDLAVASEDAEFGYPEVRLGFVPAIVMVVLRRSLGERRAFELVSLAERFDAATAREYGLACRVLEADGFRERAEEFLAELAGRSGSALALTKRLLYQLDGAGFEEGIRQGAEVNALARFTEDCREGVRRFLEG